MNHKNLTAETVRTLKPKKKPYRVYDGKVRGLCVVVTPAGSRTFHLYRRVGGRVTTIKIGRYPDWSLAQARSEADKLNSDIATGSFTADRSRVTWGELAAAYLSHAKQTISSWVDIEARLKNHLSDWNPWPADRVTFEVVAAKHAKVGQTHPTLANRLLPIISCAFDHAKRTGMIPRATDNPTKGIRKHKETKRKRFLSDDEAKRFFVAVDELAKRTPGAADLFLILLFTGQRVGTVRAMAWDDINLDRNLWRIEKGKHGEGLTVHLTMPAVEILKRRAEESDGRSGYVWPARSKTGHYQEPRAAWARLCELANLKDFRMHDLRHTLASWQAIHGASLLTIGASLGHKSTQATERYAHLTLEPVRDSVDTAAAALQATRQNRAKPDELTDEEQAEVEEFARQLRARRKPK